MASIQLTTNIKAPLQAVFNASRNLDLHTASMAHTQERAIAGKLTGLIEYGETVTWEAKHLFKKRLLTTTITAMQLYTFFVDEMTEGDFTSMRHEHHFTYQHGVTIMKDVFAFESPFGVLGKLVNWFFLTGYMRRLLQWRNEIIKQYAEVLL